MAEPVLELESDEVDADEVRAAVRTAWIEAMGAPDFKDQVVALCGEVGDEPPLTVTQGGEGFGVVTSIVIGVSARVVGGAAEKLLALVAARLLPVVKAKLPGVLRQKEDEG